MSARAFKTAVKVAELKHRRRMREQPKAEGEWVMACQFCYTDPDLLCAPGDCYLQKRQEDDSRIFPAEKP